MKVVIDTNVLVSRFLSPDGVPAVMLALEEKGLYELVVSEPILDEYRRVLSYPRIQERHQLSAMEIGQVIAGIRSLSVLVEPAETLTVVVDDPSDNRFLEAATVGQCDFIVTGAPHLLRVGTYEGVQIVTPAAFLSAIQQAGDLTP